MENRSTILYILASLLYVSLTLFFFPFLGESTVILIIPLLAFGGWLFGTTKGLLLIILTIIYHYVLLSEIHADHLIYYEDKLLGVLTLITVVLLTGNLKSNLSAIRETNLELDLLVKERTEELTALASKLINDSEQIRIIRGQTLHDGIGQHMTGFQLFSTPLAEKLLSTNNPNYPLARSLCEQGQRAHNQIRQIARMLFPVKIGQVGLISALHELASCFSEIEQVNFHIKEREHVPDLPEETSLQLYRMCQEIANHAIYVLKANQLNIEVYSTQKTYSLKINHNGLLQKTEEYPYELQLIEYRLQLISGISQKIYSRKGSHKTIFTIPNPKRPILI